MNGLSLFAIAPVVCLARIVLRRRLTTAVPVKKRSVQEIIEVIQEKIQRDEGKRGIRQIIPDNVQLLNAAKAMVNCNSAAIITGFPCLLDFSPPTETDGPLGALAIAKALLLMGKKVTILTDECNEEVLLACSGASDLHKYGMQNFSLQSFPPLPVFDVEDAERLQDLRESIDLVIAIERAGPNHNGRYLTMRGRDMTDIVAPLDTLLLPYTLDDGTSHKVHSIGIGDGGNEVGMGKVIEDIRKSTITNAQLIGCVVAADDLLVSSVSNWGGYALAAATGLVYHETQLQEATTEAAHKKQVQDILTRFLPTDQEEYTKCQRIIDAGARDGITTELKCMVDGMPMDVSVQLIRDMRQA